MKLVKRIYKQIRKISFDSMNFLTKTLYQESNLMKVPSFKRDNLFLFEILIFYQIDSKSIFIHMLLDQYLYKDEYRPYIYCMNFHIRLGYVYYTFNIRILEATQGINNHKCVEHLNFDKIRIRYTVLVVRKYVEKQIKLKK